MTRLEQFIQALEDAHKQYRNLGMALPAPKEYDRGFDDGLDEAISLAREIFGCPLTEEEIESGAAAIAKADRLSLSTLNYDDKATAALESMLGTK